MNCSALQEQAAGSLPSTSQVSLHIAMAQRVSRWPQIRLGQILRELRASRQLRDLCVVQASRAVSVTPKGVLPLALCHASATLECA